MNLKQNIADAKRSVAETAIGSPYIYHEYGEWQEAKRAAEEAIRRLSVAEARWRRMIEPALRDDLFRMLAKRKGLIP